MRSEDAAEYNNPETNAANPGAKNEYLKQTGFTMHGFTKFCFTLILIAAVPFAIYVWPTKYAYDQIKLGEAQYPVRIHRLTGDAEQLTTAGWRPLRPGSAQTDYNVRPVPTPAPITPTPVARRPAISPTPRQSER